MHLPGQAEVRVLGLECRVAAGVSLLGSERVTEAAALHTGTVRKSTEALALKPKEALEECVG